MKIYGDSISRVQPFVQTPRCFRLLKIRLEIGAFRTPSFCTTKEIKSHLSMAAVAALLLSRSSGTVAYIVDV